MNTAKMKIIGFQIQEFLRKGYEINISKKSERISLYH